MKNSVLVIGGGIAGIQASLDIANAGFEVYLVEKELSLGGHMAEIDETFPNCESAMSMLAPKIKEVEDHRSIKLLTYCEVIQVGGSARNFDVEVKRKSQYSGQKEEMLEFRSEAIIVATGYDQFDPHLKPEYGYGIYPNVITGLELERLCSTSRQTGEKLLINGQEPRDIIFIQCVGSRDQTVVNPYCSKVCCMNTMKQAHIMKGKSTDVNVTVFYIDVRASGKGFEEFYDEVREEGVIYRRGNPSEIYKRSNRLIVKFEDTLLREVDEMEADLVVLAAGMVPRADSDDIARLLKISKSPDKFFQEAHPKMRPVESSREGIYLAGCCQGPKDILDTVTHASAAANACILFFFAR